MLAQSVSTCRLMNSSQVPLAALRPRVEPLGLQAVLHRVARDLADAELLKLAEDPRVAPGVLPGQPQDDLADLLLWPRPARLQGRGLRLLAGLLLALQPAEEGARRDDRHQLLDGGPEGPAELHKSVRDDRA